MTGDERRRDIIRIIESSRVPVPAKRLAADFDISRQVIVQDIALIRAAGYDILSTNRGYLLLKKEKESRLLKVAHTDEAMEDELLTIVDLGAVVDNVMVNHHVYGHIEAPLHLASRRDVSDFIGKLKASASGPLKNTTSGYHYHRILADDTATLDEVEKALRQKGYLLPGGELLERT